MIRFFGQKKFSNSDPAKLLGYEFLLREYKDGKWQLPKDFSVFSSEEIASLLVKTIAALPADLPLISFNLDQAQFVSDDFRRGITKLFNANPMNLYVELTERDNDINYDDLVRAASDYKKAGIRVVLDDVGTGANQTKMAMALNDYTSEYKFALQNIRGADKNEVRAQVTFWHDFATKQHKLFAIEGFETADDLRMAREFNPDVLQGYYFAHPELIEINN
ncbi:EAL domain-containing protein [Lacticaseibacillus pabuli]|uniref:EAL domain-containing protein n=1 Tax=Lacticaseibacillus pabuli TaxID=3025672 RepID=A0ABY7WQU6_9LACO|nr:EAL domain-containing protein [Lacticaseibacillus sp. KACC 23028]WDF82558.1 EAL domain-containing protein [Lacticaseibacillus sp. KACC 23028]